MAAAWFSLFLCCGFLFVVLEASIGDRDEIYRTCVKQCEEKGHVGTISITHCKFPPDDAHVNSSWYMQEPLYVEWKHLNCRSECRYHCMMQRETEKEAQGLGPVKYHGKWPFKRVFVFQEPVSAAFSALNLLMHFIGWLSFFILVHYKLPLRPQSKRTYYEYTGLWHIYGLLSMNAWFWSAIFHTLDFNLTEKLDYSSAVALLGYSLILSILRVFNVKDEASRVMYAAPVLAFVTTHILYLNFYELDYGWNMKVCLVMGIGQLMIWSLWAGISRHPARLKLWAAVFGCALAMLLEIYDFPPYLGYIDAHALWHFSTIPLTYLWWSFIKADAIYRTSTQIRKVK
ncbi:Per1-like protein [Dioscorea alata]|uniref:Per1-like protein n=1 Tax=Dioscorea alata TaxID=55571 RepID=A0ACB7V4Y0_DIOAL|nr:Per1-like protein [Dioscorea alata]